MKNHNTVVCVSDQPLTKIAEALERFSSYANPEIRHQAIILYASELGVSYWQLYHLWAICSEGAIATWVEQQSQQWGVN